MAEPMKERAQELCRDKEVSKHTGQPQEQHKNAKDTHYNYINHALIVH